MTTLADVFRKYGPAYLAKYAADMPATHRKAIKDIQGCRTAQFGYAIYRCQHCGKRHTVGRSCGNRHCPACQHHKTQQWLRKQLGRLLPCAYFLITFTLPEQLRRLARSHQKQVYNAMFRAASEALKTLAADPRFLGARQVGFFGVLHTWGRKLDYHPHLHFVVPAGGLSEDGSRWRPSRAHFFVPVKALSPIFRAKFRDALKQAGLLQQVEPSVWSVQWCVHSKAVGDGRHALNYLAAYVFRAAIANWRIVSCENDQVVFRYRKSGSRRWRLMTLHALEFMRRFLQHVLPSGLMKVRHYGLLSPNSRYELDHIRRLIDHCFAGFVAQSSDTDPTPVEPSIVTCPDCGHPMRLVTLVAGGKRIPVAGFDSS